MIESKVKASTAAAAVAGLGIWLLSRYVFHGTVDPVIQAEVYTVVPAVLAFAAGWAARHTPRPAPPTITSMTVPSMTVPPAGGTIQGGPGL